MAESKTKWARDLLMIPAIVGLVVAFFTYILPKWLEKRSELSFSIDGPTSYINQQASGNIAIQVNGLPTSRLFAYKIRMWNSGGSSLRDLPVRFTFESQNQSFQVFNVTHETNPKYEFGKVEEQGSDTSSKRYIYELLNPKDEDVITFLTNDDPPLNVNSKAEGLKVTRVEAAQPRSWISLIVTILAGVSSFLTLLIRLFSEWLRKAKSKTKTASFAE